MLAIRSGRSPHELALLIPCFIVGIAGLTVPGRVSTTTLSALPLHWLYVWYGGLVLGSAVALTGLMMGSILGMLIERVGLIVLSGQLLGYGIAITVLFGLRGIQFGLLVGAFAVANLWRAHQIRRESVSVRAAAVLTRSTEQLGE
jgi:hypothetical protein